MKRVLEWIVWAFIAFWFGYGLACYLHLLANTAPPQ